MRREIQSVGSDPCLCCTLDILITMGNITAPERTLYSVYAYVKIIITNQQIKALSKICALIFKL